ncbi:MAG: alpha-glucan family phosphorylase [Deltaproteobacteria bacterium]|nr:alpha-glucan family phosphorylase [Deltaproteobacteria bacterium]
MSFLQTFQVFPAIPKPLSFLQVLARNLWWCWHMDAIELFRRISPRLWEASGRNPIVFLTLIPQEQLEELSKDESFLAHQQRVEERFVDDLTAKDLGESPYGKEGTVGYFSMEFGIHESVPLFAGGLGVLAGDHLKAASDLTLPLIGVGLLYRHGYFHQFLDHEGWQQEEYPEIDIYRLPVKRVKDDSGNELIISVPGPEGEIRAVVWKIMVGRIPLILLDTNLPENSPEIREITSRLYAGSPKTRLAQEVLLGIGGMRALEGMGIYPTVCHMNEGHCAFVTLERLAQTISSYSVNLETAKEIVSRTTVFTTHTPVAAGHDEFPVDLVKPYLNSFTDRLGISVEEILSWGQPMKSVADTPISMFVLGLHSAQYCNGVSELHGKVARRMWSHVWPGRPEDEVPIGHITNGIHIPSWISVENSLLFERYLGPDWHLDMGNPEIAKRIDDIYDEELWRSREMSRSRLIRHCRALMIKQYRRRNAPKRMMKDAESVMDQDILTIAFARRFATYKRANLLLKDPERFEAIITSKTNPVQFIFAGKAHPKDNEGKELIKRLIQFARRPKVRHRIAFLEDYDISIARHLVQGADVWLNTPRRPFEACGTSGIKAAANGVLNVSILDGWWCEGYAEERGWSIGDEEEYTDSAYQDTVESQALYNVLEDDVIPCFYERRNGEAPDRWLKMMKESMKMAMLQFCSRIMVKKYETRFYLPAAERFARLTADNAKEAVILSAQYNRLSSLWEKIRIEHPVRNAEGPFWVGEPFEVTAIVNLGELNSDEVKMELYYGPLKTVDSIADSHSQEMTVKEIHGDGEYLYSCIISCRNSGRYGFTVRAIPSGDERLRFAPGLITWA